MGRENLGRLPWTHGESLNELLISFEFCAFPSNWFLVSFDVLSLEMRPGEQNWQPERPKGRQMSRNEVVAVLVLVIWRWWPTTTTTTTTRPQFTPLDLCEHPLVVGIN